MYQIVTGVIFVFLLFLLRRGFSHKYIAIATSLTIAIGSFVYIFIVHAHYYSFLWTIFVPFTFIFFLGNKQAFRYVISFYILILFMAFYGVLYWGSPHWNSVTFTYYTMAFSAFTFFFMFTDYSMNKQHSWLVWISETDALTNLYNRRKLKTILQQEFLKAKKSGTYLSVAILDIDNFKSINDNFGHTIGDEVLIELSGLLINNIYPKTFVGRWGGEEFLFIFPGFSAEETKVAIQNFKDRVSFYKFKTIKKLGCSVGVYGCKSPKDLEKMIIAADYAMYKAKKNKTKKVIVFDDRKYPLKTI